MPPKGSQKVAKTEASTPKSKAKSKAQQAATAKADQSESESEFDSAPASKTAPKTTPKTTTKKPETQVTPRKKKDPVTFNSVSPAPGMPVQIDVKYEGDSVQAMQITEGLYGHTLKLQAASPFKLVKTIKFTSGEFEDCEALIVQPAKPFPFLKLPKESRAKVYTYYFANNRITNSDIAVEGKRNKDFYAKMYANGSRYRVALLAVNKEVHEEALPILYNHTLRFESTQTVLDFWGQIQPTIRPLIRHVSIKNFVKTSARNAMHFLAESPNLNSLHVESGVFTGDDPAKAAKEFYDASYKFLEAVGARKGEKAAGVEVFGFGREAFVCKAGEDKKKKAWGEEKREQFMGLLREKLN